MADKFQPFYKMHALRCGTCSRTVEIPRRRLANAIREMVAHISDASHQPFSRTERIVNGTPE
jgi:hypothetical protein